VPVTSGQWITISQDGDTEVSCHLSRFWLSCPVAYILHGLQVEHYTLGMRAEIRELLTSVSIPPSTIRRHHRATIPGRVRCANRCDVPDPPTECCPPGPTSPAAGIPPCSSNTATPSTGPHTPPQPFEAVSRACIGLGVACGRQIASLRSLPDCRKNIASRKRRDCQFEGTRVSTTIITSKPGCGRRGCKL
jgi:hypothetical protein